MNPAFLRKLLAAAIVATLLLLLLYQALPAQTYSVISNYWLYDLIDEGSPDHSSRSMWKEIRSRHFSCDMRAGESYGYCGINFYTDYDITQGVDLSDFTTIRITATFQGDVEIVRFFMRDFNPEYAQASDPNSAKFIKIDLKTDEFRQTGQVDVGVKELMIADWWLAQHAIARRFLPIELANVTTMGFDFAVFKPADQAQQVEFSIENIEFVGPLIASQDWYLGIVLFWLLGLSLLGSYGLWLHYYPAQHSVLQGLAVPRLDPLTGYFNRTGLEECFAVMRRECAPLRLGMLVFELDQFKQHMALFGVEVAEQLLKGFADCLDSQLRDCDAMGRWKGERFVVLCLASEPESLLLVAEKVLAKLSQQPLLREPEIMACASVGATLIQDDKFLASAFKHAEQALFEAKLLGKNHLVLASRDKPTDLAVVAEPLGFQH